MGVAGSKPARGSKNLVPFLKRSLKRGFLFQTRTTRLVVFWKNITSFAVLSSLSWGLPLLFVEKEKAVIRVMFKAVMGLEEKTISF